MPSHSHNAVRFSLPETTVLEDIWANAPEELLELRKRFTSVGAQSHNQWRPTEFYDTLFAPTEGRATFLQDILKTAFSPDSPWIKFEGTLNMPALEQLNMALASLGLYVTKNDLYGMGTLDDNLTFWHNVATAVEKLTGERLQLPSLENTDILLENQRASYTLMSAATDTFNSADNENSRGSGTGEWDFSSAAKAAPKHRPYSQSRFAKNDWLSRLEQLLVHFFLLIFDTTADSSKLMMELMPKDAMKQIEAILKLLLEADPEMYKELSYIVKLAQEWLSHWGEDNAERERAMEFVRMYITGMKDENYYKQPVQLRLRQLGSFIAGLKSLGIGDDELHMSTFKTMRSAFPPVIKYVPALPVPELPRPPSPRLKPPAHFAHVCANILCDIPCNKPLEHPEIYAEGLAKKYFEDPQHNDETFKNYVDSSYGHRYRRKDLFKMPDMAGDRNFSVFHCVEDPLREAMLRKMEGGDAHRLPPRLLNDKDAVAAATAARERDRNFYGDRDRPRGRDGYRDRERDGYRGRDGYRDRQRGRDGYLDRERDGYRDRDRDSAYSKGGRSRRGRDRDGSRGGRTKSRSKGVNANLDSWRRPKSARSKDKGTQFNYRKQERQRLEREGRHSKETQLSRAHAHSQTQTSKDAGSGTSKKTRDAGSGVMEKDRRGNRSNQSFQTTISTTSMKKIGKKHHGQQAETDDDSDWEHDGYGKRTKRKSGRYAQKGDPDYNSDDDWYHDEKGKRLKRKRPLKNGRRPIPGDPDYNSDEEWIHNEKGERVQRRKPLQGGQRALPGDLDYVEPRERRRTLKKLNKNGQTQAGDPDYNSDSDWSHDEHGKRTRRKKPLAKGQRPVPGDPDYDTDEEWVHDEYGHRVRRHKPLEGGQRPQPGDLDYNSDNEWEHDKFGKRTKRRSNPEDLSQIPYGGKDKPPRTLDDAKYRKVPKRTSECLSEVLQSIMLTGDFPKKPMSKEVLEELAKLLGIDPRNVDEKKIREYRDALLLALQTKGMMEGHETDASVRPPSWGKKIASTPANGSKKRYSHLKTKGQGQETVEDLLRKASGGPGCGSSGSLFGMLPLPSNKVLGEAPSLTDHCRPATLGLVAVSSNNVLQQGHLPVVQNLKSIPSQIQKFKQFYRDEARSKGMPRPSTADIMDTVMKNTAKLLQSKKKNISTINDVIGTGMISLEHIPSAVPLAESILDLGQRLRSSLFIGEGEDSILGLEASFHEVEEEHQWDGQSSSAAGGEHLGEAEVNAQSQSDTDHSHHHHDHLPRTHRKTHKKGSLSAKSGRSGKSFKSAKSLRRSRASHSHGHHTLLEGSGGDSSAEGSKKRKSSKALQKLPRLDTAEAGVQRRESTPGYEDQIRLPPLQPPTSPEERSEAGQGHEFVLSSEARKFFKTPLKAPAIPLPEKLVAHLEKQFPNLEWPRGKPVSLRYYPSGQPFCVVFNNGAGRIHYPHGGLAVAISAPSPVVPSRVIVIRDPFDQFYFYDKAILADLGATTGGTVFDNNGVVRVQYNAAGGYRQEKGRPAQRWQWHCGGQRMVIKLNRYMALKIMDISKVHLVFYGHKRGVRLNVGLGQRVSLMSVACDSSKRMMRPRSCDAFDYMRGRFEGDQSAGTVLGRMNIVDSSDQDQDFQDDTNTNNLVLCCPCPQDCAHISCDFQHTNNCDDCDYCL